MMTDSLYDGLEEEQTMYVYATVYGEGFFLSCGTPTAGTDQGYTDAFIVRYALPQHIRDQIVDIRRAHRKKEAIGHGGQIHETTGKTERR